MVEAVSNDMRHARKSFLEALAPTYVVRAIQMSLFPQMAFVTVVNGLCGALSAYHVACNICYK